MSRLLAILSCFQIVQNIGSVACNLVVFSNIAFLVASIAQISPVAGNLVVPSKSENIGWLQQLKFFPVACNLVVFSSIVTYLVSSII